MQSSNREMSFGGYILRIALMVIALVAVTLIVIGGIRWITNDSDEAVEVSEVTANEESVAELDGEDVQSSNVTVEDQQNNQEVVVDGSNEEVAETNSNGEVAASSNLPQGESAELPATGPESIFGILAVALLCAFAYNWHKSSKQLKNSY